jgi:predicted Ser/Thr protein kinase
MRSLESLIGINSPSEASVFRTNFLVAIGEIAERGEKISWRSHKKIEEAIRAMIIKEHKSLLRAALVSRGISEEADRTYEKIVQRLIKDHGYSENTAKRLLEYAGELVNYT